LPFIKEVFEGEKSWKKKYDKKTGYFHCILVELCRISSGFEVSVGADNYVAFCYICIRNFTLNFIGNQEMLCKQQ